MGDDSLGRLREICLALPGATEQEAWGDPTFRVRDKIFAMRHAVDGHMSMWCKAPPGGQGALVGADPGRFFVPTTGGWASGSMSRSTGTKSPASWNGAIG